MHESKRGACTVGTITFGSCVGAAKDDVGKLGGRFLDHPGVRVDTDDVGSPLGNLVCQLAGAAPDVEDAFPGQGI